MKNNLNLVNTHEYIYKKKKWWFRVKHILPESITIAMMVILLVGFKLINYSSRNQLENIDRQLEQTGEMVVVFENLEHEEKMLDFYQEILGVVNKESIFIGEKISIIYQILPENTRITLLEYESKIFMIYGRTKEQAAVKELKQNIGQKIGATNGQIISIRRIEDIESEWWEFTMEFELETDEEESFV